ncbi:hypothetical protein ACIOD1_09530 [Streptomyces sp. NPDC088097]|uniref:hypothetical protein n=1 Tax=Streptomyces sp. NPDC088097 TaxID=3365823 RepID=UPI0037F62A4C
MAPTDAPRSHHRPRRAVRGRHVVSAGLATGILVTGLVAAVPAHGAGDAAGARAAAIGAVPGVAGDAHYAPGPCPTTPEPDPDLKEAHCGTLTVPEDRREPDGHTITLGVAVVPAATDKPKPDPVVWLAGGPGDDAVSEIPMAIGGGLNRAT